MVIYAGNAPAPPDIPEVQSVVEYDCVRDSWGEKVCTSEKIRLTWDDLAENSIDPLTGYSDFEGYRIYRSIDGGKTWGSASVPHTDATTAAPFSAPSMARAISPAGFSWAP